MARKATVLVSSGFHTKVRHHRAMVLPNDYKRHDHHAEDAEYNCPVKGCDNVFTRMAGVNSAIKTYQAPTRHILSGAGLWRRI